MDTAVDVQTNPVSTAPIDNVGILFISLAVVICVAVIAIAVIVVSCTFGVTLYRRYALLHIHAKVYVCPANCNHNLAVPESTRMVVKWGWGSPGETLLIFL